MRFAQSFYGNPDAGTALIQMVDDHDLALIEREVSQIRELSGSSDFLLAAVKVNSWNEDLSPWPAPPVFGDKPFGSGAGDTLHYLTDVFLPTLQNPDSAESRRFLIGGYSLYTGMEQGKSF